MSDSTYLKCSCAQCGGHIEFPSEALGTDANCPHCGNAIRLEASPSPAPKPAPAAPVAAAPSTTADTAPAQQPQKATVVTPPTAAASKEKRPQRAPRAGSALDISFPELEKSKAEEPAPKSRNWFRTIAIIVLLALIPVAIISWIPKKLIRKNKIGNDTLEM